MGLDGSLRSDSGGTEGSQALPAARRAAVCQRRDTHRHGAQQDPQGSGGQVPQHAGLRRALSAGLGLPWPPHRAQGGPRARPEEAAAEHRRLPPRVSCVRREIRRDPEARLQAARHHRRLERPVLDDGVPISGVDRARPRQVRRPGHGLQGQEARPLVHALPDGSGRSRGGIRAAYLAVHLRRVSSRGGQQRRIGEPSAGAGRATRVGPDLDDHSLDDPVEPGHRVSPGVPLRRLRRERDRGHRRQGSGRGSGGKDRACLRRPHRRVRRRGDGAPGVPASPVRARFSRRPGRLCDARGRDRRRAHRRPDTVRTTTRPA